MNDVAYLGIDLGTGSTKVAVVDGNGRVLGRGVATHPVHSPEPGAAETDPADWLASVRRATDDAVTDADHPVVDAIGLYASHSTTPASSHAAAIASASAADVASGFSHRTCLPAAAARRVHSRCRAFGSGRYTASTSGSARTSS